MTGTALVGTSPVPADLAELLLEAAGHELRLEALLLRAADAILPRHHLRIRKTADEARDWARVLRRHGGLRQRMARGVVHLGRLSAVDALDTAVALAQELAGYHERLLEGLRQAEAREAAVYVAILARGHRELAESLAGWAEAPSSHPGPRGGPGVSAPGVWPVPRALPLPAPEGRFMESHIDLDAIESEMEKAIQVAEREAQECRDRLHVLEAGVKRLRRARAALSVTPRAPSTRRAPATTRAATGQGGPTVADLIDEALEEAGEAGLSRAALVVATGRSDSSIGNALQANKGRRGWECVGERFNARWKKA